MEFVICMSRRIFEEIDYTRVEILKQLLEFNRRVGEQDDRLTLRRIMNNLCNLLKLLGLGFLCNGYQVTLFYRDVFLFGLTNEYSIKSLL